MTFGEAERNPFTAVGGPLPFNKGRRARTAVYAACHLALHMRGFYGSTRFGLPVIGELTPLTNPKIFQGLVLVTMTNYS